jgi:methylmalonyl-CoA/ethylmalonyl-CoA epimerase
MMTTMKLIRMAAAMMVAIWCSGPVEGADLPGEELPAAYKHVDQVIWVVSDMDRVMDTYRDLGFSELTDLGKVRVDWGTSGKQKVHLVCANVGGAHVNWIEPAKGDSPFNAFLEEKGEGIMSLVHRFPDRSGMDAEVNRLNELGINALDKVTFQTEQGDFTCILMDTRAGGTFNLGFVSGNEGEQIFAELGPENRDGLKLNQYAFAIRDPEPVSAFWHRIGLPEFQINHPELGEPHYYGKSADHDLIQGWQRHGDIAYEWCIPVKPPIVYEDHIQLHGEGIHHLAFSVEDMDRVLEDFTSLGYVVSMGGTWGKKGKPGSGRYEYIDLDRDGGVTMELLWNYTSPSQTQNL